MTPEQQRIFTHAAIAGVTCGLSHRYEWYQNYLRMLEHGPYDQFAQLSAEAWDAFLAFENECRLPEEGKLTMEDLWVAIGKWYDAAREQANKEVHKPT